MRTITIARPFEGVLKRDSGFLSGLTKKAGTALHAGAPALQDRVACRALVSWRRERTRLSSGYGSVTARHSYSRACAMCLRKPAASVAAWAADLSASARRLKNSRSLMTDSRGLLLMLKIYASNQPHATSGTLTYVRAGRGSRHRRNATVIDEKSPRPFPIIPGRQPSR